MQRNNLQRLHQHRPHKSSRRKPGQRVQVEVRTPQELEVALEYDAEAISTIRREEARMSAAVTWESPTRAIMVESGAWAAHNAGSAQHKVLIERAMVAR